jgi:prepilin-type N-terminal cleavage/methylation domain-containing protein
MMKKKTIHGSCPRLGTRGFTLLEVLVALVLLATAVSIVLQLFTVNLRMLSASEDYVSAVIQAESKMREVLDTADLVEKVWTEVTPEGYTMDIAITKALENRTEDMGVQVLEIGLTMRWRVGTKERSLTLKTMKLVEKKV